MPTSVKVLGWLFIGIGALWIATGVLGVFAFRVVGPAEHQATPLMEVRPPAEEARGPAGIERPAEQAGLGPLRGVRVQDVFLLLLIGVGVFLVIAGIEFLRLRAWAQSALEVFCWLSLACSVALLLLCVVGIFVIGPPGTHVLSGVHMLETAIAVVGVAVYVVPLIVVTKFLRGDTIRAAMGKPWTRDAKDGGAL